MRKPLARHEFETEPWSGLKIRVESGLMEEEAGQDDFIGNDKLRRGS